MFYSPGLFKTIMPSICSLRKKGESLTVHIQAQQKCQGVCASWISKYGIREGLLPGYEEIIVQTDPQGYSSLTFHFFSRSTCIFNNCFLFFNRQSVNRKHIRILNPSYKQFQSAVGMADGAAINIPPMIPLGYMRGCVKGGQSKRVKQDLIQIFFFIGHVESENINPEGDWLRRYLRNPVNRLIRFLRVKPNSYRQMRKQAPL